MRTQSTFQPVVMSKIFLKTIVGLTALTAVAALASVPVSGTTKQLKGHVPAVLSRLTPAGRLPGTNVLHLTLTLPVHNQAGIDSLLAQINDPSSPNYHHYLTPQQYNDQFGPTAAEYQSLLDYAKQNGMVVRGTRSNRSVVDVDVTATNAENLFHVQFHTYQHPTENRQFYAPDTEPTVDASLPVLTLQGMNNYVRPRSYLYKHPASVPIPSRGSGPFGGYMGSDYRNAYVPGTTLTGAGQYVGLLQFDGYNSNDITAYGKMAGVAVPPLINVLLDGFDGSAGYANGEVCLDIESVMSMAPGVAGIVVFEAGPFGNPDDILSSMVSSNQIKQFSASWGYDVDAAGEQFYKEMALQGQTFLNASGDGDAWTANWPVLFPSCDDPNITIVGGTTLTMNGLAASYASEKAWNWGFAGGYNWNPDGYVGTSGGVSSTRTLPTWQQGINMSTNLGSTTMRNVPDVSLTADNVLVVYTDTTLGQTATNIFGGTSCASPFWAGFMALVNQQAAANGQNPPGFINPAVYSILKSGAANYTNCFHDVALGNNQWDLSGLDFPSVSGYDLCTGVGSPNGTNLIFALANTTATTNPTPVVISAPLPPWGNSLSVMNGSNPNGAWFLFVQDDKVFDVGMIDNGWSLALTTGSSLGTPADVQVVAPTNLNITLGGTGTLTLGVTNYGPVTATNVVIVDSYTYGGLSLAKVSPTNGVTLLGSSFEWSLGNLPVNSGASLTLTFNGVSSGISTNLPTESASTYDPNPDDKAATTLVSVGTPPPPVLTAQVVPSSSKTSFYFTVSNSAGYTTIIQATTNLLSPNWVNVFTDTAPYMTNVDVITNFPARFYRAVLQTQ